MIAICFGIHLSFTMSSMLCVQGLRVLHNKDFESTLLCSNIRPILFEFCDLQYVHSIQYGTTLHFTEYWKRPERQRLSRRPRAIILDNSWAKNANLWLMLNCNLFSITLSPDAALILLKNVTLYRITDHWWLDQTVKKLIAFRSRKFIAFHLNPSVLNNASVLWCAQKVFLSGPCQRLVVHGSALLVDYRISLTSRVCHWKLVLMGHSGQK